MRKKTSKKHLSQSLKETFSRKKVPPKECFSSMPPAQEVFLRKRTFAAKALQVKYASPESKPFAIKISPQKAFKGKSFTSLERILKNKKILPEESFFSHTSFGKSIFTKIVLRKETFEK